MASSIATPSAGADTGVVSGGFDSELGASLSAGWDAAADEAGIEAGQETADAQPEPGTESEPVADPSMESEPAADPNAPPAEDSPYQLSPDGKSYLVPKTALPQLQAAQKFHDAVTQFFGTPQEAQTSYYQASDHRAMGNDWMSGSPDAIAGVLNHWAGANHAQNPAIQARFQQSFVRAMTDIVPSMLQKMNPQAYEGMISASVGKAVELAYAKAAHSGNAEDFKRAQELDWGATGQYKTELPKVDPNAQRLTQAEQQMKQFEQRQSAAYQRDVQGFNQTAVEGAKFKQLDGLIDKTLAPAKGKFTDIAYADLKAGIHRELIDKLRTDAEWYREHGQTFDHIISDYKQTWQQGNPGAGLQPRVQSYIQNFLQRANRYLPSIAAPRITAATKTAVSRTQQGQFAGKKPAPAQVTPGSTTRVNGSTESRSEKFDRELAEAFKS